MEQTSHTHSCIGCGADWDHDDPACDLGENCDCEDCLARRIYWEEETVTTYGFRCPEDPNREPDPMERKLMRIGGFGSLREMDEHYRALAAKWRNLATVSDSNSDAASTSTETRVHPEIPLNSTEGVKAALEFSTELDQFNTAMKYLLAGTSGGVQDHLEFVDINATVAEVELVTTGASSTLPAEVSSSGYARVPLITFQRIGRAIRSLPKKQVRVRIDSGKLKIGSMTFAHPEITLRLIRPRIADLPIGAPLRQVLAVLSRFRPEEIEDSGLLARALEAREEASRLIDRAFLSLEPLGVERAALSQFISQQIAKQARGGR